MKLSKNNLNNDQPKTLSKLDDKKSVNIKWNSKLFFQIGLIVSLLMVYFIMQTNFKTKENLYAVDNSVYLEEPPYIVYTLDEPVPIPKKKIIVKQKLVSPKILDQVVKLENNVTPETDITKFDEDKAKKNELPETRIAVYKKPEKKALSIFGVEQVPVFPGCESLITNSEKRNCMSDKIKKHIQKKFNTDQFIDDNLIGKQVIRVQFYIDETGGISNVIAKADNKSLEKEAIRVISNLPQMTPAKQGNKEVKVQYMIPIVFKMD